MDYVTLLFVKKYCQIDGRRAPDGWNGAQAPTTNGERLLGQERQERHPVPVSSCLLAHLNAWLWRRRGEIANGAL